MADPLKIDQIKLSQERPRYFAGRYLLEADFESQHDYLNDRLRYHRSSLHVSGIVEGLGVSPAGSRAIKIEPGAAIDKDGNLIVLPKAIDSLSLTPDGNGVLSICYQEVRSLDKTQKPGEESTYWQDSPILIYQADVPGTLGQATFFGLEQGQYIAKSFSGQEALLSRAVKLDELTVGTSVVLKQGRGDYSGLRLPGASGEVTLRSGGQRSPGVELKGSLSVTGSLSVKGDLILESGLTLQLTDSVDKWAWASPGDLALARDTHGFITVSPGNQVRVNLDQIIIQLTRLHRTSG